MLSKIRGIGSDQFSLTEYYATATLDQVRRYLVLLTRGERFCDGHIAGEFDGVKVIAALRRARELRAGV